MKASAKELRAHFAELRPGRMYEAEQLGVTNEQFARMAYGDPGPSRAWASGHHMNLEEERLMRRLRRWNG